MGSDGTLEARGVVVEGIGVARLRERADSLRTRTYAIVRRRLENAEQHTSLQAAFPAKDLPRATWQSASSRKFEG